MLEFDVTIVLLPSLLFSRFRSLSLSRSVCAHSLPSFLPLVSAPCLRSVLLSVIHDSSYPLYPLYHDI